MRFKFIQIFCYCLILEKKQTWTKSSILTLYNGPIYRKGRHSQAQHNLVQEHTHHMAGHEFFEPSSLTAFLFLSNLPLALYVHNLSAFIWEINRCDFSPCLFLF